VLKAQWHESPGENVNHRGATYSTGVPMMRIFNNLVMYKQDEALEQPDTRGFMSRYLGRGAAVGLLLTGATLASPALAQKQGGILKIYHRDSPASMSILEEATISTVLPMMGVFNNLAVYDQNVKQNSLKTIVPDLATSWSTNEDGTQLTFKLRDGVKWHDGKLFTAKDVVCTWDLLLGKSQDKLRTNPRKIWYHNIEQVTANGDSEAAFHLKRPQPALIALLASGYSPIYPCHVPPRDMRTRPIGTGPFNPDTDA
jgi:peptide/nickel transport system substrate-binding protein